MVEFALVAIIFFSLIFGVIEGGRLLFTYHQVNHAAREGVRYAAAHGDKNGSADEAEVAAHIMSKTTGLSGSVLTVDMEAINGNGPRQPVKVTVIYQFEPIVGLIFGTSTIQLSADSTMRFHY